MVQITYSALLADSLLNGIEITFVKRALYFDNCVVITFNKSI